MFLPALQSLNTAIEDDFRARLPGYHKSQRGGVCLLSTLMLECRTSDLMELAACQPRVRVDGEQNPEAGSSGKTAARYDHCSSFVPLGQFRPVFMANKKRLDPAEKGDSKNREPPSLPLQIRPAFPPAMYHHRDSILDTLAQPLAYLGM